MTSISARPQGERQGMQLGLEKVEHSPERKYPVGGQLLLNVHWTHFNTLDVVFPAAQVLLGAYCPAGQVHGVHSVVSVSEVPSHRLEMYCPAAQPLPRQGAQTRSELVLPVQGMSLYWPAGHAVLQSEHLPS